MEQEFIDLILFTANSKEERDIRLAEFEFIRIQKDQSYCFQYHGNAYSFSIFSDQALQKYDKKLLEKNWHDRVQKGILRTLKLACSMDFINPRVAVGSSFLEKFNSIILCWDLQTKTDIVFDYAHNLVMKKSDYYQVFQFIELNVLNKLDLYNIYSILQKLGFPKRLSIVKMLLFSKEILKNLSRHENFQYLNQKYSEFGINCFFNTLFGNYIECLYFQTEDEFGAKYREIQEELDEFTKNPEEKKDHIWYHPKNEQYLLVEKQFGYASFDLLSDRLQNQETRDTLLSDRRYGDCHNNSWKVAKSLHLNELESIFIVGGKFKINELDYFFHSWVEVVMDKKVFVLDFNHNLIMEQEKYYQLYNIVVLQKTAYPEMIEISNMIHFFETELQIQLEPRQFLLNYFGTELMRDLSKNSKMFSKKFDF